MSPVIGNWSLQQTSSSLASSDSYPPYFPHHTLFPSFYHRSSLPPTKFNHVAIRWRPLISVFFSLSFSISDHKISILFSRFFKFFIIHTIYCKKRTYFWIKIIDCNVLSPSRLLLSSDPNLTAPLRG